MTVNYKELFDLAYSTRISESLKDEILSIVELPIQESTIELPQDIYESIYFLDTLAYSSMSEDLANEMIDRVFEDYSEEYLEQVYEAYIQAKAIQYVREEAAPVGLKAIERENKAREAAQAKKEERKRAVGKAVGDFKEGVKKLGQGAISKVKDAVGKVKDWYKTNYDRPIGLAKISNFKAQNKQETPKAEAKPENRQSKIDYLKKFVSKDTGDKSSSNPMATFKAIARHGRKSGNNKVEGTETNKQVEEPKSDAKPEHKQLTFLTKAGRIAKKYQAQKPEDKPVDAVVNNANQNKSEDAKGEGLKETPKEKVVNNETNKTVKAQAGEGAATATIVKPKEGEKTSETSTENSQGTSTDTLNQTSTSDTTKQAAKRKSESKNGERKNNTSKKSNDAEGDNEPSVKALINDVTKGKMTGTPKKDSETTQNLGLSREKQAQIKAIEKQIKDIRMEISAAQGKPSVMARIPEMEAKIKEYEEKLKKLQGGK